MNNEINDSFFELKNGLSMIAGSMTAYRMIIGFDSSKQVLDGVDEKINNLLVSIQSIEDEIATSDCVCGSELKDMKYQYEYKIGYEIGKAEATKKCIHVILNSDEFSSEKKLEIIEAIVK